MTTPLLPGPPGVGGDYWVGDTVTVHTGPLPWDFTAVTARIDAITVQREDANAELAAIAELAMLPPGLCTGYNTDWALASQGAVWSTEPDPQYPDPWPNFPVQFADPEKAAADVAGETGLGGFACFLAELWVPLDVDLGAARVVNRITFDQTYNAWTRTVQISDDGLAYTTLIPEFVLTSDPMVVDLDTPVEARYWRFLHHWINDDGGGHWKYVGIQSYEYIALLGCP